MRTSEGFLGPVWALDFTQYVKSDYRILSAKEVVENYSDQVSAHVKAGGAAEMNEFVKTLVDYLAKDSKKLSKKRKDNLLRFVQDSKNETSANFWATWSGDSKLKEQADDWFENPKVKLRMLECFGNPNKTKARREALAKQIEG